ncbi:MAG: hypothetical protein HOV80_21495 [Polyangiaceae bacterium]|nr:hypothetical protein [Polyangiaceae bacterium]
MRFSLRFVASLLCLGTIPVLTGAKGDGCAAGSKSPAPDVAGDWAVTYEDEIGVEVKIGGAVYTSKIGVQGGEVTIDHEGKPLKFDLDCSRPEIVCPAEAWPEEVAIEQKNTEYEHQMIVHLPKQSCSGTMRAAKPEECGANTINPDCEDVCDGEITVTDQEAFGVIGEEGDSFRLYLGGGIASNGVNCALLGWSVADADLVTEGEGTETWVANDMKNGVVTVAYAGGCLWVANVDADPDLEAAVLGASVTFTVGFTSARAE